MSNDSEIAPFINISQEESYKKCAEISRNWFKEYHWTIGNLPRDSRRHVFALMSYLTRALEMMDSKVSPIARRDDWSQWRDEVRDALRQKFRSPEMPAVVDTVEKFEISREFLFDIQTGVELVIRCKKFEAFDQWLQLGSRIGGSMMLSLVPVLGFEKEGYRDAALACGEALFLTQLMDEMGNSHQNLMIYAPRMMTRKCELQIEAVNPKKPGIEFDRFVRLMVSRIEPRFAEGGKLIKYLSFDGKRVMRSLIAIHWQMLVKMKHFPERLLLDRHQLTRKEMFQLRFKHLMGLEGRVPVVEERSDHDHH